MRPLIGRTHEVATLVAGLTAEAHSARLVAIEGEPGVGKTRLLDAVVGAIPAQTEVLRARGLQLERERPFAAMVDALRLGTDTADEHRRRALSLLTGEGPAGNDLDGAGDAPMLRFRVVHEMVEIVRATIHDRPVVLVVEDLHWVDDASQLMIEQLVRRLSDQPLTVVVTTRPLPSPSVLDAITAELTTAGVLRVQLDPLSRDDVQALVADLLDGVAPGPDLMAVLARADGNPLYVTELVTALLADTAIEVTDGVAEVIALDTPASLDTAVLSRIGYLPPDVLEVLRVASLLGARFALDDLSVILEASASELLRTLDVPLRTGILMAMDAAIAFRHDLIRDAIYRDVPGEARRALHLQAARRLADAGRPATQVATHYLEGARPGDLEAIGWLARAATEALPRSPAIAAELYEGAIALCGPEHPERDPMLVNLLIALTWSGRNTETIELVTDLEARPQSEDVAVRLDLAAARALHLLGREHEALQRYAKVVDAPQLSERQRARVVADIASASILVGALDDARSAAEDACARGRQLGDDPALCGGLGALCYVATVEGRTLDAVAHGEAALRVARESSDRETARRYPQGYLGVVLMDADRLEEGSRVFDEGRRVAEALGDRYQAPTYDFGRMLADFYAGRLDDAEVALAAATHAADEVGFANLIVWSRTVAARIAIRRDDLGTAARHLDEADAEIARVGPRLGADWLLWCRALLAEAQDDLAGALGSLRMAWELASGLGLISQGRLIAPDLVRLLLKVGDRETAATVAAEQERAAEVGGTAIGRAVALRCRGLVDTDADALLGSVELYRASPRELERADAMRDAAACLEETRSTEARQLLQEALASYVARGAVRDQRSVEASLRSLGVHLGKRGQRARPAFGWDALTPTELEVAHLVAEGLSNPEIARRRFVSPRTIDTHLSNAFTKLGVTSRVALAAEVLRHDP